MFTEKWGLHRLVLPPIYCLISSYSLVGLVDLELKVSVSGLERCHHSLALSHHRIKEETLNPCWQEEVKWDMSINYSFWLNTWSPNYNTNIIYWFYISCFAVLLQLKNKLENTFETKQDLYKYTKWFVWKCVSSLVRVLSILNILVSMEYITVTTS